MAISILFSIVRWAARYSRPNLAVSATEDIFMFLALAFYVTMDGLLLSVLPVVYQRLDNPVSSVEDEYIIKVYFAINIIFWPTVWCVKFSQLSTSYRLTDGLACPRKYWYIVTVFTILAIIGAVILSVIPCSSMTAWLTPGITFDI